MGALFALAVTLVALLVLCLSGCSQAPSADEAAMQDKITDLQRQVSDLQGQVSKLEGSMDSTNVPAGWISEIVSTAETLNKVDRAEDAGTFTHDQAKYYRDVLAGRIQLYVGPDGKITTNAFSTVQDSSQPQASTSQADSTDGVPADVRAKIEADAAQEYPDNYVMQQAAIESQEAAYKSLHQ